MIAEYIGIAYVSGLVVWVVSWGVGWSRARNGSYGVRTAARMLLLAPIWPIMLVLMTGILIVELWKDADWGNG